MDSPFPWCGECGTWHAPGKHMTLEEAGIDSMSRQIADLQSKLQAALDEKSSVYAELAKYLDLALPKVKPSCIVCGRSDYDEPAIKHMVIGSVVVCAPCRDAPSRLDALTADRDQWKGRADQLSEERDTLEDRLQAIASAVRDWRVGVSTSTEAMVAIAKDGLVEIGVSGKPRCDGTHAPPDCNDPLCWRGPIANL